MSEELSLTNAELMSIEASDYKRRSAKQSEAHHKLRVELAKTQLTLLSANYTLKSKEVEALNKEHPLRKQELIELEKKHLELVAALREKYDLPEGKWGYDPSTGLLSVN